MKTIPSARPAGPGRATCWRACLVAILTMAAGARAQTAADQRKAAIDEQLEFIDGLQAWGLTLYVNEAISDFITRFPDAADQIGVLRLKGLLAVGDFEKAKAMIAAEPDQNSVGTWRMKLALADAYYAWGKYGEVQGVYSAFFKQFPDTPSESMNDFYRDSAHRYAQMLILMGNDADAIGAYRLALKAKMERYIKRQLQSELTELIVRVAESQPADKRGALLAEARKLANEILWVRDLWFGKAIVYLAHIEMIEGNPAKASKLVEDYKADLQAIHDQLVEDSKQDGEDLTRLSPMAECRYLLGSMMQTEAEKLIKAGGDKARIVELLAGKETGRTLPGGVPERSAGAYQHFLTVFILFPSSQWAPEAGARARQIEDILRVQYGAQIDTKVTEEQMERVRRFAFQNARSEFNQQLFEKAVASYLEALLLFPESEVSVAALGELCQCYLELGEEAHADCVASYLSERFSGSKEFGNAAGDQMIRLATYCGEHQMPDRRDAFYDYYFTHFAGHPRLAGLLYMFGEERTDRQDYDGALKYYSMVLNSHTNSPVYAGAASRAAFCYSKLGDATNEIRVLQQLIDNLQQRERPGSMYINARFRLAQAYMQLGEKYLPTAYNRFTELVALIRKEGDTQYANSGEDREANQKALEGSLFYSSIALSRIKPSEDKVALYRQKAIDGLEDLVRTFPQSAFAPAALNQVGTFYVLLEKPEEARTAFDRLRKDYPGSDEAKNSRFLLAKALLELGYRDKAVAIFKEMFEGGGDYTGGQILTAGRELLKAGEAEIALQAFDRVLKTEKDRPALEPATLGKGQALLALGRVGEAGEVLKQMLNQYQNSGYTVPACLALSQAFAKSGSTETDADKRGQYFRDAVKAMNRARMFEKAPGGRAELDVGVARIYANMATSERQFGTPETLAEARGMAVATYQTLITLADARDAEVRKHIETAYGECLPLLADMEKWEDVLQDADQYLELFPRGPFASEARAQRTTARTRLMAAGKLPATDAAVIPAPEPAADGGTNTVGADPAAADGGSTDAAGAPEPAAAAQP